MKKFLFLAAAVITMTLAACSSEQKKSEVDELGDTLKEQIEKNDKEGVIGTLTTIKEKIAELATPENVSTLKEQLPKFQQLLNDNKEQILSVVGENATVESIISTVATLDASSAVDAIASQLNNTKDAAVEAVEATAENAVEGVVDAAKDAAVEKANEAVTGAQTKVNETVNAIKEAENNAVDNATNKAAGAINDAANKLKF